MKCDKCGVDKSEKGRSVVVYYGKILREETEHYNTLTSSKTVNKTYYRNIESEGVHICAECLSAHRKRKLITLPLKWLIPLAPFIYSAAVSEPSTGNTVFSIIIGVIMLLVITYSTVKIVKKKYEQKPYKYDAYPLAKRLLKKKLKKNNPKARYTFWREMPKNLKQVKY